MKAMDDNLRNETVRWQEKLFQRSVRRQMRVNKLRQLLGATSNQQCLEVTSGDGIISSQLRELGGSWTSLATDMAAQASLCYFLDDEPGMLSGPAIDAPDQSFDAVVVVDALERVRDDYAFIRECHRVLKTDGRLVITAARKPLFGCMWCALLGLSWKRRGQERPGYSASEFFDVLKDGFDVPETVSYSSWFVDAFCLMCESAANKLSRGPYNMPPENAGTEEFYHYRKLNAFAVPLYPLMWLAMKLDEKLLFFMPGRNIAAKTKRRVWRSRKQPVLIDGRSIAEAAINTKIGTAAPF